MDIYYYSFTFCLLMQQESYQHPTRCWWELPVLCLTGG